MQAELVPASEGHLQLLLPLVAAYHTFESFHRTEAERESAVRRLLNDRSLGGIWLVQADGELAGYIALCKGYSIEFGGHDAFIDEFYLEPAFRGKGLGRQVLELIKEEARNADICAVHLEVARNNTPARTLYARAGFAAREKYVLMSINLL